VQRKLFGEVAVEKGYVTPEQIEEALAEQDRGLGGSRKYRFIGEILVEKGLMTEKQVLDVLAAIHDRTSSLEC